MPVRSFFNSRITGATADETWSNGGGFGVNDEDVSLISSGVEFSINDSFGPSDSDSPVYLTNGVVITGTMPYDVFPGIPTGATINSVRWVYDWSYAIAISREGGAGAGLGNTTGVNIGDFRLGLASEVFTGDDDTNANPTISSLNLSDNGTYDVTDDYTGSPLSYDDFIAAYSTISLGFHGDNISADFVLFSSTGGGADTLASSYSLSAQIDNFRLDVDFTDPDAVIYLIPETEEVSGVEVIVYTPVEVDLGEGPPSIDAIGPYLVLPDLEWWTFPDIDILIFVYTYFSPGTGWEITSPPAPYGWFRSLEEFAGGAIVVIGGVPRRPRTYEEIDVYATGAAFHLGGSPGCAVNYNNRIIYARGQYTGSPTIGVFDGLSDRTLTSLPLTTTAATPIGIMSMIAANGLIYLTSIDSGSNSSNWAGRVFELNPLAASLAIVGSPFTGGQLPYCLTWHNGRLWCGTNPGDGTPGKVYWFRPGIDTVWTEDFVLDDDSSTPYGGVCSMISYGGKLYVGTSDNAGGSAVILARDTAGTYAISRTGTGIADNNAFLGMIPFGDNLYATYWSDASDSATPIAEIHKFDGSTWSIVYDGVDNDSDVDTIKPYVGIYVASNTLFVIGGGANTQVSLLRSDDGTEWDDVTVFLPTENPVIGIPVFAEIRT